VLGELPQGVSGLAFFILFYCFSLVYLYNRHQVLVGLPQGVGGLAFFISSYFSLVYLYNRHQVLVSRAPPKGWWPSYCICFVHSFIFTLVKFICITRIRCSQGSPKRLVALIFYFILFHFTLVYFTVFCKLHQVLLGLPQGVGGLAILIYLIYLIYLYFISV
jgi:hypothetical protein